MKWLSIKETIATLKVSDKTIRRWVLTGKVKSKKVNGKLYIQLRSEKVKQEKSGKSQDNPNQTQGDWTPQDTIRALHKQIEDLTRLLSQQQSLQMDMQKRLALLESPKEEKKRRFLWFRY